jgi:type VI secretion system protein ImpK
MLMDVLARLALAQAARLARRGEYPPAEALLGEAARATSGPRADILDLRARIHAQQGHMAEAEALWREALSLDPGNSDFQAALSAVARPSGGRIHMAALAARSLAVVVLLLLAWTLFEQRRELGRVRAGSSAEPPTAEDARPLPPVSSALVTADIAARRGTDDAALLDSLAAALAPLGELDVLRGDQALEVRFREGLFGEGAALRTGAHDIINRIARSMAPQEGRVSVLVVGHTDPVPLRAGSAYSSNHALGLARATRVAGLLLDAGALPPALVTVQSLGDASPPFPGDTAGENRRNRTVTLRITPAR